MRRFSRNGSGNWLSKPIPGKTGEQQSRPDFDLVMSIGFGILTMIRIGVAMRNRKKAKTSKHQSVEKRGDEA